MRPQGTSLSVVPPAYANIRTARRLARDAARNFADEDCSPALTFRGCFGGFPANDRVFVLADGFCEAVVNQRGILKTQFFVPRAVVDFRRKDLFKGAARKIVWPVWH